MATSVTPFSMPLYTCRADHVVHPHVCGAKRGAHEQRAAKRQLLSFNQLDPIYSRELRSHDSEMDLSRV